MDITLQVINYESNNFHQKSPVLMTVILIFLSVCTGELGGLMGLLLGASVLTLGEIMDLFFYNAIRKCIERRRGDQEKSKIKPGSSSVKPPSAETGVIFAAINHK